MHPKHLSIADFTYTLPEEKIAKYPVSDRASSKLLVFKNELLEENVYKNIDQFLPSGSLMVFNNTKVIEARLLFQKPSGAFIEIFCLEPDNQYGDITTAIEHKGSMVWLCLIGGASKWKPGQVLRKEIALPEDKIVITAEFLEKTGQSFAIRLSWSPPNLSFGQILHAAGTIPLPPYLKRGAEASDSKRYQTVYADKKGSVAAPTAGLHFTKEIFEKLASKQIVTNYVTLHVGAGTFKPVKTDTLEHHEMHEEFIDVDISALKNIIQHANRFITAVGTTSLRTIESLYWMGVKVISDKHISLNDLSINQWEPYKDTGNAVNPVEALSALAQWMEDNGLKRLITKTQILIAPGYEMKVTNALITNFHQPNSTLLLLVAAFIGKDWKKIYEYALEHQFRFLSYGDGCLLFRH